MKNKVKTYCFTCLILTFLLTLLRCISLTSFYDVGTGYFNRAFIPTVMNVIYVIGSVWYASTLIFIPRASIKTEFTPSSVCMKGASAFSAMLFIFSAVLMLTAHTASKFDFLSILATAVSALFFIFVLIGNNKFNAARAFTAIALVAALTVILASLYFDMTIAMNSPHKIHTGFILMSAMIFGLCEIRTYLGNPLPRIHLASALITFMLGISFVLSAIFYILAKQPSVFIANSIISGNVGYVGIIAGVSVYAISRCFTFEDSSADKTDAEAS